MNIDGASRFSIRLRAYNMRVFTGVAGAATPHRSDPPPVKRPSPARRLSSSDRIIVA
jgi:hypothetical protein